MLSDITFLETDWYGFQRYLRRAEQISELNDDEIEVLYSYWQDETFGAEDAVGLIKRQADAGRIQGSW